MDANDEEQPVERASSGVPTSRIPDQPVEAPARPTGDRYRELFDLAPEPYLLTDAEGRIRLANARTLRLLDRPREEVEGRELAAFLHPDDQDALVQQLGRVVEGAGVHAWEVRLVDGSTESQVLASVEPYAGPEGTLELRWVLWDAMPLELVRRRLHRLLEDSQGDAAALRALAEWQASLLGSAAQDMRTPLTVVGSTIESLLEDGTAMSDAVARSMLERAARQVMKMRRMLPTLLQLGRLQLEVLGADRETIVLRELVDEVLHDLGPVERDVTYQFEVAELHADPHQLARVLLELVTHVQEHAPADTPIRIGTLARGIDAVLFLDASGYRIDDRMREDLFSPFLGTGRNGAGAARGSDAGGRTDEDVDLGLSLVAVFARMHGGRAWVQDAPEDGMSFRILLSNAIPD